VFRLGEQQTGRLKTGGNVRAWVFGIIALLSFSVTLQAADTLLKNVVIYDGTGAVGRAGDVRIHGDRITEIGKNLKPKPGETVRDEKGMAIAPGFIDMHSHADGEILEDLDAENSTRQGITTVLVGQDGESKFPLANFLDTLDKTPAALNVASMVGHGTLREQVMDAKNRLRKATPEEIAKMKELLAQELKAGAFGLSTGLEYDPGHFATTEELIDLSKLAAANGGFYISHVRDEGNNVFESYREIVEIGKQAKIPVEITHIKLGVPAVWGGTTTRMPQVFKDAKKDGVDLRADVYPYTYWQSNLRVIILNRDYYNPVAVEKALEESGGADHIWITGYKPDPSVVGETMAEIAKAWGLSPVETYIKMAKMIDVDPENEASIMAQSMNEDDVRWFVSQPNIAFCSDGGLKDRHPRGAGSFPKVLGRYVREQKALPLEMAIHKMTGLAADHIGLKDRGYVKEGYVADLVVFDPATVADKSTIEKPQEPPVGILDVMVSGELVVANGKVTGAHSGKVLRKK